MSKPESHPCPLKLEQVPEEQYSAEEFNCKRAIVKDEGSNLNVVSSFPGMLVVIVLLLIAIAVVAVWPTH